MDVLRFVLTRSIIALALACFHTPPVLAANGQCVWEGGPGAPTYPLCQREDCIGSGGFALCENPEIVPSPPWTEGETDGGRYRYHACDVAPPSMAENAGWCVATGGTWNGPSQTCIGGSGPHTPTEDQIDNLATAYINARFPGCSVNLTGGADWGGDSSSFCWGAGIGQQNNVEKNARKTRQYHITCPSTPPTPPTEIGKTIAILRDRTLTCPAGTITRTLPNGFMQCVRRAEGAANCGDFVACPTINNPISIVSGAKIHRDSDYRGGSNTIPAFERFYRSSGFFKPWGSTAVLKNPLATWQHSYQRQLVFNPTPGWMASLHLPDGRLMQFDSNGKEVLNLSGGGAAVLQELPGTGWLLTLANHDLEYYSTSGRLTSLVTRAGQITTLAYDGAGQLTSVTGPFGHELSFAYDSHGRLASLTAPGNLVYSYGYDAAASEPSQATLTSVTYPDTTVLRYHYDGSKLTGITDENNARFTTYTYDEFGRVHSTERAGGANRLTYTYGGIFEFDVGGTSVTDSFGQAGGYDYFYSAGVYRPGRMPNNCQDCDNTRQIDYDSNGNPGRRLTRTGSEGGTFIYSYDPVRNLETSRTEGYQSSAARTITTQWHPTFRLPTLITEAGRTTSFAHDPNGNVLSKTVTDTSVTPNTTRTWTYTYNNYGQVLTADSPRTDVSDVTTYTYHSCITGAECGQLATVTNALGQVTTFNSYNDQGQPLTITDSNGMVTTLTYDARQRLTSRSVGGELTSLEYWPTGLLKKVTLPDSSFLLYTYDDAHRLTQIEDEQGNRVAYTLDSMGNRTAENVYDPTNFLTRAQTRVFDTLNRLQKEIGAAGTAAVTTSYTYNFFNQGKEVASVAAPLERTSWFSQDSLNRLIQTWDPALGVTQYSYDADDNVTSVTDPRGKVTSYQYTGFGDLKQLTSPDTGTTISTYDSGGNFATSTDARSKTATYNYDALNRITSLTYPDQTIGYTYDSGTNQKGRLTQVTDASGSTSWTYDTHGRVLSRQQSMGVTKTLGYDYDSFGRLQTLTLPSGNSVTYGYTDGKITSLTLNGSTTILSSVLYEPFGPTRGWTWGNGTLAVREHDTDGKLTALDSAGLKTYDYDDASRITGIADASEPNLSQTYSYDKTDRLVSWFAQVPDSLTIDLSATSAAPGDTVTVTVEGIPAGTGFWLALAPTGVPVSTYSKWIQVTPSSGSFVWNVTMPSFAGTYEVRLFRGGFGPQITSAAITVSAPPPPQQATLTANASTVAPGGSVTVRLVNASGGATDWLALAAVGASTDSFLQWTYVGDGVTQRDWTVTMPSAANDYEFRHFLNNGFTLAAASGPVWVNAQAPVSGGGATDYTYDTNGNRLTGEGSTYTVSSTSNRTMSVSGGLNRTYSYDNSGNITGDGTATFTYNDAGRMVSATKASVTSTYSLNALGQRVKKTTSGSSKYFVYDEAGHLVGEYDSSGNLIQETVWFDDTPVATLRPNGGGVSLFYVHTDHLNTPRRISRPSDDVVVWRWDSDPFGTTAANEDPDGDSNLFVYGLRFPGQYFDSETGLHYNYFRDYEPSTGRYAESDPIGLRGGINTYAYAGNNPTGNTDPLGLLVKAPWSGCTDAGWKAIQQAEQRIRDELKKPCVCTPESNGSCIPCNLRSQVLNALDTSVVRCPMGLSTGEVCGWGELGGNGIKVLPPAFGDYGCGCLALTIYHELLHNVGLYDSEIPPLERACGGLCANGKSGGPTRRR